MMDGISVYKARLAMGEALANAVVRKLGDDMDVDVVIPVRLLPQLHSIFARTNKVLLGP